jgi:RNA-binding protein
MAELRKRAHHLRPAVLIGKNGLTEGIINEVGKHLKQRKLIKVRLLKSAKREEGVARKLAAKAQAVVVNEVGHTIVLYSA